MKLRRRHIVVIPVLALALALAACSVSALTANLGLITAAAEIALPVVAQATGADPATIAAAMDYIHRVSTAITETAVVTKSGDTAAVRAEKITAIWSGVVLSPAVLNRLPPNARPLVQAVAVAVQNFLSRLTVAKAAISTKTPGGAPAGQVAEFKVRRADRTELDKIIKRATEISVKAASYRAR